MKQHSCLAKDVRRHAKQKWLSLLSLVSLFFLACGAEQDVDFDEDLGIIQEAVISSTAANALIVSGRAKLGTWQDQCKKFVQSHTLASYGVTVSNNDGAYLYKWLSDTTPQTNVARWLGSYVNGRLSVSSLAAGATSTTSISVPNADLQSIVLYAGSTGNVVATLSKSGATTLTTTNTGGSSGTVSSTQTSGSGTWTLSVKNNSGSAVSNVEVAVLSYDRFRSDWRTARRGDIIQLFGGTGSDRNIGGPHTAFIQTDYNDSTSSCVDGFSGQDAPACNWLDSNWAQNPDSMVRAHRITMEKMMLMVAYKASYGFTIYRLN